MGGVALPAINVVAGTNAVAGNYAFTAHVNTRNATTVNTEADQSVSFLNMILNGHTLTKTGQGTMTINGIADGGSVDVQQGTLAESGTLNGDLTNNGGTLAPGNSVGTMTVNGNLDNAAAGTVLMEIEGTAGAGVAGGHDQIQVTGGATLDGTLEIAPGESYADPTTRGDRDHFTLLTAAGGVTGTFSTVNYDGSALSADFSDGDSFRDHQGDGLFRNVNYDGTDLRLTNLLALEGDADGDIDVDITDFNILASNFDDAGANSATNDWTTADFDADGDVDITDFNFLAANFADTGYGGDVTGGHVPEPTSLFLVAIGGLLLIFGCRTGRVSH